MQIYCPYLVINKTGLPFAVKPGRSNRMSGGQDMAGETRAGILASLLLKRYSDQVLYTDMLSKPTPFSKVIVLFSDNTC